MPVLVLGGLRDDPVAIVPPQSVSDLRNLLAESKLPRPVGVTNSDEGRGHSLSLSARPGAMAQDLGHDGRRSY